MRKRAIVLLLVVAVMLMGVPSVSFASGGGNF